MYQDTKSARLIAVCKRSLTCNLAFRRDFRSVTCSFGYIVATDFSVIYTYLYCCYNIFCSLPRPSPQTERHAACVVTKIIVLYIGRYIYKDTYIVLRFSVLFYVIIIKLIFDNYYHYCHYYQIIIIITI